MVLIEITVDEAQYRLQMADYTRKKAIDRAISDLMRDVPRYRAGRARLVVIKITQVGPWSVFAAAGTVLVRWIGIWLDWMWDRSRARKRRSKR